MPVLRHPGRGSRLVAAVVVAIVVASCGAPPKDRAPASSSPAKSSSSPAASAIFDCERSAALIQGELSDSRPSGLPLLGTVHFGDAPDAVDDARELHDARNFAIDDRGRFGVMSGVTEDHRRFVLLDAQGRPLREIDPGAGTWTTLTTWIEGDRWIAFRHDDASDSAYWIDVATGTVALAARLGSRRILGVARTPDGGFVVLTQDVARGPGRLSIVSASGARSLLAFDREGRQRWQVADIGPHGAAQGRFEAYGLAVVGDRIVVPGRAGTQAESWLTSYDLDGTHPESMDLNSRWDGDRFQADRSGHLVVVDGHDPPSVRHMTLDGKLLDQSGLDMRVPRFGTRGFAIDADGHLWGENEYAFLRFDAQGKVDRTAGPHVDDEAEALRLAALDTMAVQVDASGRIYAEDWRNGNIHVFGPDGRRLRILPSGGLGPDPDDAWLEMQVSPGGDVYLIDHLLGPIAPATPSRTASTGSPARTGTADSDDMTIRARVHFAPDGKPEPRDDNDLRLARFGKLALNGSSWRRGGPGLQLVHKDGTVEATVAVQGTVDQVSSTPDGGVAVLQTVTDGQRGPLGLGTSMTYWVRSYAPDGAARTSWKLPSHAENIDRIVADGTHLAVNSTDHAPGCPIGPWIVMDDKGRALLRFASEDAPAFVDGKAGRELWVRRSKQAFDRYRLP